MSLKPTEVSQVSKAFVWQNKNSIVGVKKLPPKRSQKFTIKNYKSNFHNKFPYKFNSLFIINFKLQTRLKLKIHVKVF